MNKINILDHSISNKIAAGEVVERPASVVKELVENSIDAGAKAITIEIKKGGITYIRVTDNGSGIERADAVIAFERHATSKLHKVEDLDAIQTLGFRGEALASIAAVSHVELITKTRHSNEGTHVIIQGGKLVKEESVGCPEGTTIVVKNLFYNTPARMKFLKKDSTEAGYVGDLMNRIVLGRPEISFRYINNGKEIIFTPGDNNLMSCIYSLYGKDYAKSMIPVEHSDHGMTMKGFIGKSDISRANRNFQSFFINGRYIKSKIITYALEEAYKNMLMVNRFPFAILHLSINPLFIDVNVHPNKMEVKFSNEKQVYQTVYWAVKNALYAQKNIPEVQMPKRNIFEYTSENNETTYLKKNDFVQQEIKSNEPLYGYQRPNNHISVSSDRKQNEKQMIHKLYSINTADQELKESSSHKVNTELNKNMQEPLSHSTESAESKAEVLTDFKIIGQIFDTYIIVQKGEEMLLIDQHAAHERLKYEELIKNRNRQQISSQVLFVPIVVQLSATENDTVISNINFFSNIGFEIEDFGNNSIVIRQTPIDLQEQELKDLFLQIILILQEQKNEPFTDKELRALYSIACKSAIKANQAIHMKEAERLIADLLQLDNINTCPHGRPIIVSLSKYYLEKQFKRIQ